MSYPGDEAAPGPALEGLVAKWARKEENNWWKYFEEGEGHQPLLRFKLRDERNEKYEGDCLPGYSDTRRDVKAQFEDVLQDATHIKIQMRVPYKPVPSVVSDSEKVFFILWCPMPFLEDLSIAGCNLHELGELLLRNILHCAKAGKFDNVKSFAWDRNRLDNAGIKALADAIKAFPSLTNLSLRSNYFGPEDVHVLVSSLETIGDLRSLDLGDNRLEYLNSGMKHAMEFGHLQALERLCLKDCYIGDDDVKFYEKALSSIRLEALREIDLSSNFIGDSCAQALGKALSSGRLGSLTGISLSENQIGDEGAEALGKGFQSGKVQRLVKLDLSFNRIGDDGMGALAASLEVAKLTEIADLDLSNNYFGKEGNERLAKALESGNLNSLQQLCIGKKGWEEDDVEPLVVALSMNTALTFQLSWRIGRWEISEKRNLTESSELGLRHKQQRELNLKRQQLLALVGKSVLPASFGKVYICGNFGVGKTTLRRSLQRGCLQSLFSLERGESNEPRTRGIEVCKISHKNEITLTLWDMAGQDEFHLIHNAFLSDLARGGGNATIFMIVCTSKNIEEACKELHYWLRFIASSVGPGRSDWRDVFVVINNWDSTVALNEDEWKDKLSPLTKKFEDLNIHMDPLFGDVRKKRFANCVEEALIERSRGMLRNVEVPEICDFIQKELSTWSEQRNSFPVLSWSEFGREIKKAGAKWSTQSLEAAVSYLNETGVLIYVDEFPREGRAKQERLVVLNPDWFCSQIVGNMFVPRRMGKEGEALFRGKVDPQFGSISMEDFNKHFKFLESGVEDDFRLINILLWLGLCYEDMKGNIFIPALIEEVESSRYWPAVDTIDREGQWVMGYSIEHVQNEIAFAPIALWHKFEVALAQTHRFNGQTQDSDFVAGKYFTAFKVDYMEVFIEVHVDEAHPTFERIDIYVRPFWDRKSEALESHERKKCQLDLGEDIVRILVKLWNQVCPKIGYVQRVMWPRPACPWRPKFKFPDEPRENPTVVEVKKWVQEHGFGRPLQWKVGNGEPIKEDQLLSSNDKADLLELLVQSIEEGRSGAQAGMEEAVKLQIFPSDVLKEIDDTIEEGPSDFRKSKMNEAANEKSRKGKSEHKQKQKVMDRSSSQPLSQQEKIYLMVKETRDISLETRDVALEMRAAAFETRDAIKETLKASKDIGADFHHFMSSYSSSLRKFERVGEILLQDREHACPKFIYVGEKSSSSWVPLKVLEECMQAMSPSRKVHIYFACEAEYNGFGPHKVSDQEGIDLPVLKDWAGKIAPWLQRSLAYLCIAAKATATIVAPSLSLVFPDGTQWGQAASIAEIVVSVLGYSNEELEKLTASTGRSSSAIVVESPQELYGWSRKAMVEILGELTPADFKEKLGLQKVLLNPHSGYSDGVKWICNVCYKKYRCSDLISHDL